MSIEKRLNDLEDAMGGPSKTAMVVVHVLDPEREAKIAEAKAAVGERDDLVIVNVSGGYRECAFS